MPQPFTRRSRLLASVLALALALVAAATCVAAVLQMPAAQSHACCPGMNSGQHCNDSMAEQRDCCLVQSADLAGIARASQSAPSLVLLGEIVIEPSSPATVAHAAVSDPGVPIGTPPPTYLLDSVFRI